MSKYLTIIAPVFNEEESLPRFREEMDKFLDVTKFRVRVVFVNDGSSDASAEVIKQICDEDSRYTMLALDRNYGLSTAIKAGIDYADSEYIGYIDTDLQTSPSDFDKFYDDLGKFAMVNGIRARRKDTFIKKISSKIANTFRRAMINDGIEDTCCPLKIMQKDYAKKIPFFKGMHRFIPALIQLQGGKVRQVPVQHFERFAGTAKYHLFNRLVGPFTDTLVFVWMKRKYIHYDTTVYHTKKEENIYQ